MKYSEGTFRDFYHRFVGVEMSEEIRSRMVGYQGVRTANWVLCYGYIDNKKGFCFEVLACARQNTTDHLITVKEPNNDHRITLLAEEVKDMRAIFFNDKRTKWNTKYKDKLDVVKECERNEAIQDTRNMKFLDPHRDPYMVDYFRVYFFNKESEVEVNWVKMIGLTDHQFIGELITEPGYDSYRMHVGCIVYFNIQRIDHNNTILASDVDEYKRLTDKDLEDGSMLDSRLQEYMEDNSELNRYKVLTLLRDSVVWVPCNLIMEEEDSKCLEDMVFSHEDDLESLIGSTFTSKGPIRMKPIILEDHGYHIMPVFSNKEAVQEYVHNCSTMIVPFVEMVEMARMSVEPGIDGIVVNPFTTPYLVDKNVFDVVDQLVSILEEA